jgi:hypothetical protein
VRKLPLEPKGKGGGVGGGHKQEGANGTTSGTGVTRGAGEGSGYSDAAP